MSTPLSPSVTRAACCSCRPPAPSACEGARFGRRLHHRRPRGRRQPRQQGRRTRTTRAAPAAADGRACARSRVNAVGTPARRGHRAAARLGRATRGRDAAEVRRCGRAAPRRGAARRARATRRADRIAGRPMRPMLARDPQVVRVAFGHLDFQLDLGMRATPDEPELAFARNALVAASRRAVAGADRRRDHAHRRCRAANGRCPRARAFGFGGKLASTRRRSPA